MSSSRARPSSLPRSRVTLRLPRLGSSRNGFGPPEVMLSRLRSARCGSPVGGSILMTSAPRSASMAPAAGTKVHAATSTTLMPSSGFDIVGYTLRPLSWEDSIASPPVVSSPGGGSGAPRCPPGVPVLNEYQEYRPSSPSPASGAAEIVEFRDGFRAWLRDNATVLAEWRGRRYPPGGRPDLGWEMEHGGRLMGLLWEAGWGRAGWPAEAGGSGGRSALRAVLLDELWAHDIEVPHQYEALEVMAPPLVGLRPDLIAEHLAAFASGRECWVQGFSEPEAGSDIASLRTRARRDGEGPDADFLINGQKVWGSLGIYSSYAFVLARTGTPESRHRGLTMFFLPLDSPGVTVRPIALASGVDHLSEIF